MISPFICVTKELIGGWPPQVTETERFEDREESLRSTLVYDESQPTNAYFSSVTIKRKEE